ncbi:MAG: glycosyltransferase family 25 protein [Alphaproteobacteria bacterium]|nr:glycosyltransferase family 25 protein [Alphaproteobacteria bacterium]
MTLPVFVINLDRRPDRWAAMSAQLDRLGIAAARIPAVDARLLAAQEEWERDTNGNAPAAWTVDLGAVACAWSHRKALRAFLDTGEPAALILEDDAELADDTPSLLETVDWWPPEARMITLTPGAVPVPLYPASAETPSGRTVHRFERFASCAAAYLMTREGAELVSPYLDNPELPTDVMFFDHRYSRLARELRAFQMVPGAARQIDSANDTDLEEWRQDVRPKRWRNLQALPYRARLRALLIMGKVSKRRGRYSNVASHKLGQTL